jgi:predicted membrane-bound dolichyl-phosphate-mannose-protein mannosyltransferase
VSTDTARDDRQARVLIAVLIGAGVALRLLVLRSPGFPSDVGTFAAWAERMVEVGPARFYDPSVFTDYPPGYLYVLWLLGALFDGELLRLAVKAASIPADIAIAVGAAMLVWRQAGRGNAVAATALWMLSPAQIFAGPYWGQIDAVGTLPMFAALVAAGRSRWALAALLGAVAMMIKPQFGVGLGVIVAAALIEWVRDARWRPIGVVAPVAAGTILVLGRPFGSGPAELIALVRTASETYPYTSLYAFNVWSVVADFWKPDDEYVAMGGALLALGLLLSCLPLWRRRDVTSLLFAGACAAFAFYFLPTRSHERYIFPAFALLLPFAATRVRVLWPYLALALTFAVTLYYAFTRYPQNDLRAAQWLEDTVFSPNGQIVIAVLFMGLGAFVVWLLARGESTFEPSLRVNLSGLDMGARWPLPAVLSIGAPPSRRDLGVALLVALVVLLTRGYRIDQPRDMYFDEVYHARTAFELLAQREPYEWTHPHLAKEIMALSILALGDDRVVGREALPRASPVAFAVDGDGTRAYASSDGVVTVRSRAGAGRDAAVGAGAVRALAIDGARVFYATDRELVEVPVAEPPSNSRLRTATLPFTGVTSLALSLGRIVVGGAAGAAIYPSLDAAPLVIPLSAVAITARPDGTQLFLLDGKGDVHVLDPTSGRETQTLTGGGPGRAIAYAQGPNRIFVARASEAVLDVFELPSGQRDSVRLGNARTGSFASGATALAVVPQTQFLYALADGRVVVVEPHGASAFAAIATPSAFLGVDGDDDKLLAAGADGVDRIETGRHGLAWRLPGVLFGAALAFFVVLLARRLFAAPRVAYLAGAAVVLDGSMFAQARIGMNDIYVAALIVAAWYFVAAAQRPRRSATLDLLIGGALLGFAVAAKWAGVYALAAVFVLALAQTGMAYVRGRPGTGGPLDLLAWRGLNAVLLFGCFAVIPVAIYLASYQPFFGGPTAPYGWNLVELTQQMYWYHSSLTAPHCAGAPWWSWPLDLKPTYWYFGQSGANANAYIYDAGNLVLFWAALPAAALVSALAYRTRSFALGIVALAMLAQYVAWIPISRVLFFYHFFTVLPFYLLCLAVVLAVLWERSRRAVLVFVAVAAACFVVFYPYVSGLPVRADLANLYFVLPTWQYDPAFYTTESCSTPISASIASSLTVAIAWLYELAAVGAAIAVALGSRRARDLYARVVG